MSNERILEPDGRVIWQDGPFRGRFHASIGSNGRPIQPDRHSIELNEGLVLMFRASIVLRRAFA